MSRIVLAICALLPALAQQPLADSNIVIAGAVSGEDGSAVVGAYVTLHLSFTPARGVRQRFQTQWGLYSGSGGSFRFTGLRSGTYRLCAQTPGTAWLDPCEWGFPIPSVTVASAERSRSIAITLRKGAEVPIRIDDPVQILLQSEGKIPGAHLLAGVRTAARTFSPALLTSQDGAGRTLKVVIPFDLPVSLTVASSFFKLAEQILQKFISS